MTRIAGFDPGLSGGAAIVTVAAPFALPALVDATDIPVAGVGAKRRVDVSALRLWLSLHKPDVAFIERAQAMPKQGSSSGFVYGRAVGAIEATILCAGIRLEFVEASMWKKRFGLRGKDKEAGRQRALHSFPERADLFSRKLDHNRAEACLIALYGAETTPMQHAGFDAARNSQLTAA